MFLLSYTCSSPNYLEIPPNYTYLPTDSFAFPANRVAITSIPYLLITLKYLSRFPTCCVYLLPLNDSTCVPAVLVVPSQELLTGAVQLLMIAGLDGGLARHTGAGQ